MINLFIFLRRFPNFFSNYKIIKKLTASTKNNLIKIQKKEYKKDGSFCKICIGSATEVVER